MPASARENKYKMPVNCTKTKIKYSVLHRSDLHIGQQRRNVRQAQYKLQSTLKELDSAKSPNKIESLRTEAASLKKQTQEFVLVLQVMEKLNSELTYARADLKDALHKGNGNIDAARKRVIWLEDKMGQLCSKKHLKDDGRSDQTETPTDQEADLVLEEMNSTQAPIYTGTEKQGSEGDKEDSEKTADIVKQGDKEADQQCGEEDRGGGEDREERNTFMTEVEGQTARSDHDVTRTEDLKEQKDHNVKRVEEVQGQRETAPWHDATLEYWQSEHHQFEFSEFAADILTEINQYSYHNLGLAVPASFVKKEKRNNEFQELPWRIRRRGSDIKDVHREALDQLALCVHGLHDKIYNAAMISARADQQESNVSRETSVFPSSESRCAKQGLPLSSRSNLRSAPSSLRPKKNDIVLLSKGSQMKREATQHLVFYPKPIPPPQILPIARTNRTKEYPQLASAFAHPDPGRRKPVERLVDQENLLEETRLVLYRDKKKSATSGTTSLERNFQMIEDDSTMRKQFPGKKMKTGFKTGTALEELQRDLSNRKQIKSQSREQEHSHLRWERLKMIVHVNLKSERVEERIDGARQLGLLRCSDTMILSALKEKLYSDPEDRVRYEAAKSLILNGCWEEEVVECILKYLVMGNKEIRMDVTETLKEGISVQNVDKSIPSFIELVKVLSHLCCNPDPKDVIAFNSAICLGQMCVKDEGALTRLMKILEDFSDTHSKAKALEILVKQLHVITDDTVNQVQKLLKESPVWKHRVLSCNLLISLGLKHECVSKCQEEIYQLLEKTLWDDPCMDVRLTAAEALTALGMFTRVCLSVEKKLESTEEDARVQAVIAVGTLGMKTEKMIRRLLEMLVLDANNSVRRMIIRTFGVLKLRDGRVLRRLKEREKSEGNLAREAKKTLKILDGVLVTQTSKSPGNP